jgi:predicted TIM-barrel enzyme
MSATLRLDWFLLAQRMTRAASESAAGTLIAMCGGVTHPNAGEPLSWAHSAIDGSALEEQPSMGPVSAKKARSLVHALRRIASRLQAATSSWPTRKGSSAS